MNAGELKVDQATTLVTIEDLTAMMDKEVQTNTRIVASLNDDTDFGPTNHKKGCTHHEIHGAERLYETASMHHH